MSGFGDLDRVDIDNTDEEGFANDVAAAATAVAITSPRRPSGRTTSLNEGDAKICSVSFKEGGTVWVQEQSKEDFADHILMPESKRQQQPPLRRVQGSPDIPIDSPGRDERSPLAQSLPPGTSRNYTRGQSPRKLSAPTVYCVHGNAFGVARCCENLGGSQHASHTTLTGGGDHPHDDSSGELNDSTTPVIGVSESRAILDPNCQCHGAESNGETTMDKKARRKLVTASILCLVFMIVEVIGGVLAGSLAIATDAAHLLTDFASFMISLFSLWVAARPATRSMSWGWHRAEVIGAAVSVLMIWVVTGVLVYAAVLRCVSGDFEIDATIMLITSSVGVVVNIIMGLTLHQGHGHSHGGGGHGHSHDDGESADRQNVNVRAAFVHVVGDFLSSLGVLIAALIIYFKPEYKLADPMCTFIFSVLVLFTTVGVLRETMNVLMEGMPKGMDHEVVRDTFASVDGIVAVHNLRIWGLTTDKTALSAHLAIDWGVDEQKILREASAKIRAKYNIYEMTLQLERFHREMDACQLCKPPSK